MEKEYWQCGKVRKCKWIGLHEERSEIKSKMHKDINATDMVCPKCGNDEFYTLNEKEYQKIKNKIA